MLFGHYVVVVFVLVFVLVGHNVVVVVVIFVLVGHNVRRALLKHNTNPQHYIYIQHQLTVASTMPSTFLVWDVGCVLNLDPCLMFYLNNLVKNERGELNCCWALLGYHTSHLNQE